MTVGTIRYRAKSALMVAFAVCFCLDYVKGGCLSYGHSCWGGHGKRSGPPGRAVAVRTIPAPPVSSPDLLWPNIEQSDQTAAGNNGGVFEIPAGSVYYQPRIRAFRFRPEDVMNLPEVDVADASSLASDENYADRSTKSTIEDTGRVVESEFQKSPNNREDHLRSELQRRKVMAALLATATGTEPGDLDENSYERLFLNPGVGAGLREPNHNKLLKLLGLNAQVRKYGRSS
ncbi:uncharacterized protein LOC131434572 isoform X1 [Malaya genurostris]|uniref:uncharacterized protein LOC131434572 isoform X1 n=1 Tax=Malaya genurostris TaxID=325434 RepID=UPI0026F3DB67|nr:uncharacterized protein LOC131434572 isoform X1 [Malaya genurostris]